MALRLRMLRTPLEWTKTTSSASKTGNQIIKCLIWKRNRTFGCHIFHFGNCFCNGNQDFLIRVIVIKEFDQTLLLRFAVLVHNPKIMGSKVCLCQIKGSTLDFFSAAIKFLFTPSKNMKSSFLGQRASEKGTVKTNHLKSLQR